MGFLGINKINHSPSIYKKKTMDKRWRLTVVNHILSIWIVKICVIFFWCNVSYYGRYHRINVRSWSILSFFWCFLGFRFSLKILFKSCQNGQFCVSKFYLFEKVFGIYLYCFKVKFYAYSSDRVKITEKNLIHLRIESTI